jgi:hypothetical protein
MTNTTLTTQETNNFPEIKSVFSQDEVKQEMAKHGLQGLEFDHSSFDTIALKSSFEISKQPFDLVAFNVTVMQTTEKYILVDADDKAKNNERREIKYSRDGVTTTDGEPLQIYVDEMRKKGGQPQIKKYLDVLVQLHTSDKYDGKIVVLSISPTSVSRISGFFYQLKLQGKLDNLNELKIRVSRGQSRQNKKGDTYYLWQFELVEAQAQQVA